ncbi:hypothetical protein SBV1_2050016 [Verrucomicrobia bacterium]|nr:hypothetical protein SBV1_2050016 [Verrucomicrobiota bacterium]
MAKALRNHGGPGGPGQSSAQPGSGTAKQSHPNPLTELEVPFTYTCASGGGSNVWQMTDGQNLQTVLSWQTNRQQLLSIPGGPRQRQPRPDVPKNLQH